MSYESSRAVAERLIAQFGRTGCTLRRPSASDADSGKPWAPASTGQNPAVATDLRVAVLDASYFKKEELAPDATALGYVAADACPVEPLVGDILESAGERHHLVRVDKLQPGDDPVVYTLHLKA